jgi:hypothetical protein
MKRQERKHRQEKGSQKSRRDTQKGEGDDDEGSVSDPD